MVDIFNTDRVILSLKQKPVLPKENTGHFLANSGRTPWLLQKCCML